MINARSEAAATKPAFRDALTKRRCLVPASGFYEWQRFEGEKRKQPWYIKVKGDSLFCFAGLWERWNAPDGRGELRTFTILLTTPSDLIRPLHDRMPVILAPAKFGRWLDPS